jgi:hypothetical protein
LLWSRSNSCRLTGVSTTQQGPTTGLFHEPKVLQFKAIS